MCNAYNHHGTNATLLAIPVIKVYFNVPFKTRRNQHTAVCTCAVWLPVAYLEEQRTGGAKLFTPTRLKTQPLLIIQQSVKVSCGESIYKYCSTDFFLSIMYKAVKAHAEIILKSANTAFILSTSPRITIPPTVPVECCFPLYFRRSHDNKPLSGNRGP